MRRILVGLACSFSVLCACGDDGGGSASDASTTNNSTNNATGDQTDGATSNPSTTMSTATTGGTTDEPTTGQTTTTATGNTTTGGGGGLMDEFGHECATDDDCKAVLGADGVCLKDILGVYNLPGGYCSKLCMLPDANTAYVKDDPVCGGPAGTYCIGADGYFEGCAVECTDNSQCPRTGYECRIMPQLGKDGDPKFCLMTEDNKI